MFRKAGRAETGFTLVEMLVFVGLTGALMTALMLMAQNSMRVAKLAHRTAELADLMSEIRTTLSLPNVCKYNLDNHFSQKSIPPTAIPEVIEVSQITSFDPLSTAIVLASTDSPLRNVPDSSVKLSVKNIQLLGSQLYMGSLKVDLLPTGEMRTIAMSRQASIFFTTDASGAITNCYTVGAGGSSPMAGVNISGSCEPGEFVTGIVNNVVQCAPVPLPEIPPITSNPGPFSPDNPGPGCTAPNCVASDYGPCSGQNCRTNGKNCSGQNCVACTPGGTTSGQGACSGPTCPGCS